MKHIQNRVNEIKNPYMYVGLVAGYSEPVNDDPDTLNRVMQSVCQYFKVEPESLRQHGRYRKIVEPRQIAMYLLCKKGVSLTVIGNYFGFDHTTVMHSRDTVTKLMSVDTAYYFKVQQVSVAANIVNNNNQTY